MFNTTISITVNCNQQVNNKQHKYDDTRRCKEDNVDD